ncbi:MAG TPA: ATP-binding protein [Anaerolineaceae bacterium]
MMPTDAPDSTLGNPIEPTNAPIRSLRELIDIVTGKAFSPPAIQEDAGYAENLPFPFLAIVGQEEMKLALLLSIINPGVGGVLLVGPRGTGKTTAVRSLVNLLPFVNRSTCYYGCTPEDIETGGIDAVCSDCAKKYAAGIPLVKPSPVHLVELPLNARLEDVVGEWIDNPSGYERSRLRRGILGQADLNVLYIDEVNLLENDIVNVILDASAQGAYYIRRGQAIANFRSRFTLIGSMNPEEGNLRPQILDRFGLRVLVSGLKDSSDRFKAYQRVQAYHNNPRGVVLNYEPEIQTARDEINTARKLLPKITIPPDVAQAGIQLIQKLRIDSLRAEITLFESARACAAADARTSVSFDDLRTVAPMALRFRRSPFMIQYFESQSREEDELSTLVNELIPVDNQE